MFNRSSQTKFQASNFINFRRDWIFFIALFAFHFLAFATPEILQNLAEIFRNLVEIFGFSQNKNSESGFIKMLLSWDKFQHASAFFVLMITCAFKLKILAKSALLLAIGVEIELVQLNLSYRDASLLDLCADGIGILGGVFIKIAIKFVKKFSAKRRQNVKKTEHF
jgi:vanZ family protein